MKLRWMKEFCCCCLILTKETRIAYSLHIVGQQKCVSSFKDFSNWTLYCYFSNNNNHFISIIYVICSIIISDIIVECLEFYVKLSFFWSDFIFHFIRVCVCAHIFFLSLLETVHLQLLFNGFGALISIFILFYLLFFLLSWKPLPFI